jgi:GTPase SAR1 family protein
MIRVIQWISEVMRFCPGVPILLVGLKNDLKDDPRVHNELDMVGQHPITYEEVCSWRKLTKIC